MLLWLAAGLAVVVIILTCYAMISLQRARRKVGELAQALSQLHQRNSSEVALIEGSHWARRKTLETIERESLDFEGRLLQGVGERPSATANILQGMGSILDICPAPSRPLALEYPYASASEALRSDWLQVGRDLAVAMADFEQKELKDGARRGRERAEQTA